MADKIALLIELDDSFKKANYPAYIRSIRAMEKMAEGFEAYLADIKDPLVRFIKHSIGCKLDPAQKANCWLKTLEEYGEVLLKIQTEKKQADADIVERVIAYINENYLYDIGISQIAEKLGVTPNYLSTLFHKRTGKGFMKYLTEIRMIKAKELLTNPGLQIQQVAEEVGYYSARHFTKLFTQFEGCYPSEYRKRLNVFRGDN